MKRHPILVASLIFSLSSAAPAAFTYVEDFSSGTSGWSTAGSTRNGLSSSVAHNFIDGRLSYLDTAAGIGYYLAPTILSGDLSDAYGGSVQFDLIIPDGMDTGHSDTELIRSDVFIWATNGDVLVVDLAQPTDGLLGEAITPFDVVLDDTANWRLLASGQGYADGILFSTLDASIPDLATESQIQAVLSDVDQVGLRAEFSDGIDSTDGAVAGTPGFNPESELDNFTFGTVTPVPEPSSILLVSTGVCLFLRRRRS